MAAPQSTCWTMIRGAASGQANERAEFARRYKPVIRAYLAARWRGTPMIDEIEDAAQEVFVECYRDDGVLQRASEDRPGGFRAFFYGVLRNVALRVESKRARRKERQPGTTFDAGMIEADDDRLSQIYDRSWAKSVMKEAAARQAAWAESEGAEAVKRVELLRMRFYDGLPIRDIAKQWNEDPVQVHRAYARARQEFKKALMDVMAFYHPSAPADAERECARFLDLLA